MRYFGHLLTWGLLLLPGQLWAATQIKLLQYDPDVQYCQRQCQRPKQWKDIPFHGLIPVKSWLNIDKGSQVAYKYIGIGHTIHKRMGPARFQLRAPQQKRALPVRLWHKVVASIKRLIRLKGSLHSTGASRSTPQQKQHFVDLVYPRNTHLREPPASLRWLPREGTSTYIVSLWREGTKQRLTRRIKCTTHQCKMPLRRMRWMPGKRYRWYVQRADCPHCRPYPRAGVTFQILTKKRHKALHIQLSRLATQNTPLHLLMLERAVLFVQHGCMHDALQALQQTHAMLPTQIELRAEILQYTCRTWILPASIAAHYPCHDEPT